MKIKIATFAALAAVMLTATGCSGSRNSSSESAPVADTSVTTAFTEQTEAASQELSTEVTPTVEPPSTDPTMPEGETAEPPESPTDDISVDFAGDNVDESEICVTNCGYGTPVNVKYTAAHTVTDFRILAISCTNISDDGEITYETTELYSQPELAAGNSLIAALEFIGDIPNNGISFVDENDVTRFFAMGMSGRDGSLYLSEF